MATFPQLKTGAVAQYPLSRVASLATQAVRFLDGSRQTYQLNGTGLRRWMLSLDLLDEAEVSAVLAFAEETGTGKFSFTDPETGQTVATCIISGGELDAALVDELNGQIVLEIEEVR
jgi:hypothetical protein